METISLLKEMFSKMVIRKNASLIPKYYHPEFMLYTNEKTIHYQQFLDSHIQYYASAITYKVEYDEATWVVQDDRLAVRVFITTNEPEEVEKKIEVILIAQYRDNKIFRLWELTYPDWSQMPTFQTEKKAG